MPVWKRTHFQSEVHILLLIFAVSKAHVLFFSLFKNTKKKERKKASLKIARFLEVYVTDFFCSKR